MRILVSNDDGYLAPGLQALVDVAQRHGDVTVVAPEQNHSGASNSLTLSRPLTVSRAANGFYFVNGTPTDCVHIALTGLLDARPDLVLSGINNGQNMGDDTLYSGTVARDGRPPVRHPVDRVLAGRQGLVAPGRRCALG